MPRRRMWSQGEARCVIVTALQFGLMLPSQRSDDDPVEDALVDPNTKLGQNDETGREDLGVRKGRRLEARLMDKLQ